MYEDLFLNTYQRFSILPTKAKGSFIYSGRRKYLDMISGIGVIALGHLNKDIIAEIKNQLKVHLHVSNLFWQKAQIDFAREFLKTVGGSYKIFLSNSGAEAVECAIKIAKLPYQGKRKKFLCFVGAFHGRTHGALSATWKENFRKPFEPLLEGFTFVPYGDIDSVEKELKKGEYAGLILEPIQGESGVIVPPAGFLKGVREICDRTETILILDEIQTGVGRTGKFWCFEWEDIKPDIFVSAKAIGGGLPLGVTACSEKVSEFVKPGMHASTFGGNPLSCAAGKIVIQKVRKKSFLTSVIEKENYIRDNVKNTGFEVEGKGLMLAIVIGNTAPEPAEINNFFLQKGIIINAMKTYKGDTRIRILPPLTISKKEIDLFLDALYDFKKYMERKS